MVKMVLGRERTTISFLVTVFGVVMSAGLGTAAPSPSGLKGDLTILISNDLEGSNSPLSTSGVLLLGGRRSYVDASAGCQALGEQLWSPELKTASIQPNLDYYKYYQGLNHTDGRNSSSLFWIASAQNGISENSFIIPRTMDTSGSIKSIADDSVAKSLKLQALCTQTAPYSTRSSQDTSSNWQVAVEANNQTLTGYRDRLSFRFFGIRYAPEPKRFTYTTLFSGSGEQASALQYGSQCIQGTNTGSEDCLFLNIWTPYLPRPGCKASKSKKNLRPVGIWIHGGAFTGGSANDATFDGGNIVSRGDMVLVAINYRLTTLGFLALKDGVTNGNFGLADQITALDWVRSNIHNFGGDPSRITLFGQSAGAASVRALMASPKTTSKFSSAILLSNLGGLNYGTTYSKYYTISEQLTAAGDAILSATNCTAAPSQVDCLRAIPAFTLSSKLPTVARYLVTDGTYLTVPELLLSPPSQAQWLSSIKLMMGTTRDDGAPFLTYPSTTNQTAYLLSSGFPPSLASPNLFPLPLSTNATLSLYNSTSRLATDSIFRCVDQATVVAGQASHLLPPKIYYYEFDRTYQTLGWPGTDVCNPPKSTSHPYGDPGKEYFKCHSGELYYVFGNLARQGLPMRDDKDGKFARLVVDLFAGFVRGGDPNLGVEGGWVGARGYDIKEAREGLGEGRWEASERGVGRMRVLDWGGRQGGWREEEQCGGIGLGVGVYYS